MLRPLIASVATFVLAAVTSGLAGDDGDIFGFGSLDNIKSHANGSGGGSATKTEAGLVSLVVRADTLCALRNAQWGMAPAKVRAAENASLLNDKGTALVYRASADGLRGTVTYSFTSGKLRAATCRVRQPQTDPTSYYKLFENLTLYLCKTNGVPETREESWTNQTYRNDRSKKGLAIAKGWLTCHYVWSSPIAVIDLTARAVGQSLETVVVFKPPR